MGDRISREEFLETMLIYSVASHAPLAAMIRLLGAQESAHAAALSGPLDGLAFADEPVAPRRT